MNFKLDRQLTKNHTLALRYGFQRDARDNQGVGGFSLASRAYQVKTAEDTFQAVETGILNLHTINETRFRLRKQNTDQGGGTNAPVISVLDAFTTGGSPVGVSFDHQNRYELQNSTSYANGSHLVRIGGLMRGVTLTNQAMQNYYGTFTFTSLDSYRSALLGTGAGPSQFSLSSGNPLASLNQFDFGFFAQDDWRIRSNITLSGGLRYETQTNSSDRRSWAPRLGVAWAPAARTGKSSKTVIRGGFGLFYDRLSESLTLDAERLNGINQQQFLVPFPTFYPAVPTAQALAGSAQPQTIRMTDARWQAPMLLQGALGIERQVAKGISIGTNFIHSNGSHALRSRNINAPLASGIRPFGGMNGIYLYETSGVYRQNQWITSVNMKLNAKLTLSGFYNFGYAGSNTDGAGGFPSNQYDLSTGYGRAGFDVRHRFQLVGSWQPKWGIRLSPFVTLASGRPFNILTGSDNNGDGLFFDRPAFATDLSRPTVVRTPYGNFDASPLAGQIIIPRNLGDGPGLIAVNLRSGKVFNISEAKKGGDPKQLTLSINARNLLNHPNLAPPTGNILSPAFLQSTSLAAGQGVTGTRRVDVQMKFSF